MSVWWDMPPKDSNADHLEISVADYDSSVMLLMKLDEGHGIYLDRWQLQELSKIIGQFLDD